MFQPRVLRISGCLGIVLAFSSCSARGNVEVLEAQLRRQESVIRRYENQVSELQNDLKVTRRELDIVRSSLTSDTQTVGLEEVSSNLARIQTLVFNTFLTGSQDLDNTPGDEQFFSLFYPADAQGSAVKIRGQIDFEAIDPARNESERSLGKWSFSPEESLNLWHSGFLASGFQLTKKWDRAPIGKQVVLLVRFTTSDSRVFEATHSISVEGATVTRKADLSRPLRTADQSPAELRSELTPLMEPPVADRLAPAPEAWEFEPRRPALFPEKSSATTESSEPPLPPQRIDLNQPNGFETSDNWMEADIPTLR